jgi:hypothetical protein
MFEVEKPRQFHYVPRFYDPEKEKWEALKKKYAIEQEKKNVAATPKEVTDDDVDLAYFQERVRDINRESIEKSSHLTWRDLFRKREMPKFNYQPRFSGDGGANENAPKTDDNADNEAEKITNKYYQAKRQIKIRRRFDISDTDYMKPISGTKIVIYGFIAFILILIVIAF